MFKSKNLVGCLASYSKSSNHFRLIVHRHTSTSFEYETPNTASSLSYRCTIIDPTKHDKNHIGKFYKINENDYKKLDPLNDALDDDFYLMSKVFDEKVLMIRQPAIDIINDVKKSCENSENFKMKKFILYGKQNGVGKRSTLLHLLHYFQKNEWLLFHIPNASHTLRLVKELNPSESKENQFDTSFEAIAFLKRFAEQNETLLNKLDLRTLNAYKWDFRETSAIGTSFLDLCNLALTRPKFSSDIVAALTNEIKLQADQSKFKVFMAVDQFNSYYGPTRLFRTNKTPIWPNELTIIRSFKSLLWNKKAKNIVFVGAIGNLGCIIPSPNMRKKKNDTSIPFQFKRRLDCSLHYEGPLTPKALLDQKAHDELGSYQPILVDKYSRTEILNYIDYYREKRWLSRTEAQPDEANEELISPNPIVELNKAKEELIFLSGCNPEQFKRICKPL